MSLIYGTEDEEFVFNPSTLNNPMFVSGLPGNGEVGVSLSAGKVADLEFPVGPVGVVAAATLGTMGMD